MKRSQMRRSALQLLCSGSASFFTYMYAKSRFLCRPEDILNVLESFIKLCQYRLACKDTRGQLSLFAKNIKKTCPCNVYPPELHFYIIAKLGYAGVYLFFLFLLQNIDCGYSLEPTRRGGSNVYPQSMF